MTTSLGSRAVGGARSTVVWQLVRLGLFALSVVILARLLDPSDYGLLAMVTALVGIGELIRDLGLSLASVQAKTLTSDEKTNLFWVNTVIGATLSVVVLLAAWPISWFYHEPRLVPITQLLAMTFLMNGVATQFKAQLNRDLRFTALGVAETLPQALGLSAAIGVGLLLGDYRALVAQSLVVAFTALVLDVMLARWRPGLPKRRVSIARFLTFGTALAGTQALAYISKNIDSVMLGVFSGSSSLGFYNRAYQLISLPLSQMTAPLTRVAIPILARAQDNEQAFDRYIKGGQFFVVTVSALVYGAAFGLAAPLVTVLLGDGWEPVSPILQALAIAGLFRAMGQVPYWILVSKGLAGAQFRLYLIAQPLIPLAIIAGLAWGPLGVAVGCSVGYAAFWFVQMWWCGRVAQVNAWSYARSGLTIVLAVALPVAVVGLLTSAVIPHSLLALAAGAILASVWVAVTIRLVPRYRDHVRTVRTLTRKRQ